MDQNNKTRRPSRVRVNDNKKSVHNASINRASYQRNAHAHRPVHRNNERLNEGVAQGMTMGNSGRQRLTIQERAQMNKEAQIREQQVQTSTQVNRQRMTSDGRIPQRPKKSNVLDQKKSNVKTTRSNNKVQKPKKQKKSFRKTLFPKEAGVLNTPDLLLIEVTMVLLAIGLVMVFSASSYKSILESGHAWSYFGKQAIFSILGIMALFFVANIHTAFFKKLQTPMMLVCTLMVLATLFFGDESLGATRWLYIGPIRFTPSELTKPFIVLCLADIIKEDPIAGLTDLEKNGFKMLLIVISWGLIAKEDLGSAMTIFGACFAMLIVAGISKRVIAGIFGVGLAAAAVLVALEPYRLQRIFGFLQQGDASAASESAYQLTQSLYAFGSGGLVGVGIGNSGQKLMYLPGAHTDFIYAVIGEELGLIGAMLVLGLFVIFAWRGFWLAIHTENRYYAYTGFGITAMVIVQALINMGVAVGVLPITGITLPLISYGGTSIVITLASIGILLNMSRFADKGERTIRVSAKQKKTSRFSNTVRVPKGKRHLAGRS